MKLIVAAPLPHAFVETLSPLLSTRGALISHERDYLSDPHDVGTLSKLAATAKSENAAVVAKLQFAGNVRATELEMSGYKMLGVQVFLFGPTLSRNADEVLAGIVLSNYVHFEHYAQTCAGKVIVISGPAKSWKFL